MAMMESGEQREYRDGKRIYRVLNGSTIDDADNTGTVVLGRGTRIASLVSDDNHVRRDMFEVRETDATAM